MKYIYISLLMFSCSQEKDIFNRTPSSVRDINPELSTYVIDFENTFNVYVNYKISFKSITGAVGQCVKYDDGTREVFIDPTFYDNITEAQREQMLWHEMGHCSLNKGHTTGVMEFDNVSGAYPSSLMNPSVFNLDQIKGYSLNRLYYVQELSNSK